MIHITWYKVDNAAFECRINPIAEVHAFTRYKHSRELTDMMRSLQEGAEEERINKYIYRMFAIFTFFISFVHFSFIISNWF